MNNKKIFQDPLISDNPITRQVLGICSALAITVKLEPAIVMSIAVLFVLSSANVIISLIRKMIPSRIRIIVQLMIIGIINTMPKSNGARRGQFQAVKLARTKPKSGSSFKWPPPLAC